MKEEIQKLLNEREKLILELGLDLVNIDKGNIKIPIRK